MKKIIGFLGGAILCIGLVFLVGNEKVEEKKPNKEMEEVVDQDIVTDEKEESESVDSQEEEHSEEASKDEAPSKVPSKVPEKEPVKDDTPQVTKPEKSNNITIAINAINAVNYGIDFIPQNGVILKEITLDFNEGDTVYDLLVKITRENKIHMETTGVGSSIYIQGIANLYEFDCGEYSGWMYSVNGRYPSVGVGSYKLQAGDKIVFNYTCDLGKDL